jgi:hypothetical protein
MNGERGRVNGGPIWVVGTVGGSALIAVGTLIFNQFSAVSQQSAIAIDVARQHGQEINLLRGELASLRNEVLGRTGNRYTAIDAQRDAAHYERELTRLDRRLKALESER